MAENVRCVDCGLLGKVGAGDSGLIEIGSDLRDGEGWPTIGIACAALHIRIVKECKEENPTAWSNAVRPKITMERTCPEYVEWEPGFSPKEHKEMRMQERLREAQAAQRASDLKEHEAQRERDRAFENDIRQADINRESTHKWWDRGWAVLVAALSFLAGYCTKSKDAPPPVINNLILPAKDKDKLPSEVKTAKPATIDADLQR